MTQYDKMTKAGLIEELRRKDKLLSSPCEPADTTSGITGPSTIAREATGRRRVEKELRQSARRETILNRIANVFLTVSDEEMYGNVLGIVLSAMESKFGFFGFIADNGDLVIPSMTEGVWQECLVPGKSVVFPPDTWGDSLWGKAIREKKAYYSDGAFHIPEGHIFIDHFLITPVVYGNKTIGVIAVANRKGGYTAGDKDLMESITSYASPILNARLQRDRLERERKRMEEELRLAHDKLEKRVMERTEQLEKIAEALRASEERYALAAQGSNDGIWDFNLATGEAYHSPRWKNILGYEGDEIAGNFKEWESRVHPDDYQKVMAAGKAYEEGRAPSFEIEYRLRHKDGDYRWVLTRGACLRDSEGRAYRMAGSLTDITERKKLEQQLLQSQKMESVGILAGGVAHEFNNLLTAISGYGQMLQESIPVDDDVSQESIGNVLKAAERAAELTRGLLAFSRKQVISPRPVHIGTLISNAGKLIQRIIGEDIEFSTLFSGEDLLVKAGTGQIEQVLMNLATNARDAMPHGGRLSVTTRQVFVKKGSEARYDLAAAGKYLMISVADTGTGIDGRSLESIFEPFYTTKEVGKGTGLGLSIAHGIIKQHNGSILVSSEPGKGTTFNIYLPLVQCHVARKETIISEPPVNGAETLLVAEDEEIVRMFMKKILERAGYRVITADNGEDAVVRFKEHDEISLVLSDVVMPGKNGREALDEIRKMKPGIKVIFISGYAVEMISEKGIIEEGTEYITKPFEKNDLLRKIREVLDRG